MDGDARVQRAIVRGLAFLARSQRQDGGFSSLSTDNQLSFQHAKVYRTNFVPSLILSCLAGIDNPKSREIRADLAQFLLGQRSAGWTLNYWSRGTSQRRTHPYPDDLDDTFCMLSALYVHDPCLVDEAALAAAVKVLLATETQVGGPYRTWLVPRESDSAWLDVDVAVNSNIAHFLSLACHPLPQLTVFMKKALSQGSMRSPYYPSRYSVTYFTARALPATEAAGLVKFLQPMVSRASSVLDKALCLSSLLRFNAGEDIRKKALGLLAEQQSDGSWPAAAFCVDPDMQGRRHYNGCAALTTAFVLETLQLATCKNPKQAAPTTITVPPLVDTIRATAYSWARHLPKELSHHTKAALSKTCSGRSGKEIMTLATYFNHSLQQPLKQKPKKFFIDLGLANVYGWLAYTIYDDFLDDEGKPELLSVANVAHRQSLQAFERALPKDHAFQTLVKKTFDTIDAANAWELAHCRFAVQGRKITLAALPGYGLLQKLAERSLGHTLAPLAVLSACRLDSREPAFRATQSAFRHYLIARQLNDDMHDWQADFAKGQISYVVSTLLSDCEFIPGQHSTDTLLRSMQRMFWNESLPRLCLVMRRHIMFSRRAIRRSGLFKTENILSNLLDGLEESACETMLAQRQTSRFMQHYRKV